MRQIYKNALSEVNAILNNSEQIIINRIPDRFLNFIKNNMNPTYNVQINLKKGILEQDISNEAKSIIALIYRDYICTANERQNLLVKERIDLEKKEKLKREMYKITWKRRNS